MEENQNQLSNKEPEDILSSAEPASGGEDIQYRTRPRSVRSDSNSKVIIFMAVTIVIIIVGAALWFFLPNLVSRFSSSNNTPININYDIDSSSPIVESVTNDIEVDSDRDGLPDTQEEGLGLDSFNPDTDNDGLSDRDEVVIYNSDPRDSDSDDDGFLDGSEVKQGFDPNGPGSLNDINRVLPVN